ncbi:MAG: phosphatidate cytidylyltransferase [Spirochaetes bacterium]|nr:phosphatidate cytidylyltransferase [Spirochaetota bacterium]
MKNRIIIGVIGIPIILFIILSNIVWHIPFLIFLIIFNFLAINEMHHMFSLKGIQIQKEILLVAGLLMILGMYVNISFPEIRLDLRQAIFILAIILYLVLMIFKKDYKAVIPVISAYCFILFYIPYLSSYFLLLRSLPLGKYYLFLIVLLIWCNDSAAYFSGMWLGRKKLNIKASPNKTYAGVYGGLIASVIAVITAGFIFREYIIMSFFQKIIIGVVFGFIVIGSDLVESILKRSVNIKDSKGLLPGHGGILDVFDGWLVTIPLFYFYITISGLVKI